MPTEVTTVPARRWSILRVIWKCMYYRFFVVGYNIGRDLLHLMFVVFYFGRGKVVPEIKNDLLLMSATKLAADIREGRLKSEDVVQAYINRIREVEPYINATTYRRFPEALREAKLADELIESGQMSINQLAIEKPLLGIPISVKFNIKIKGAPLTGGSLDSKDEIATEDADAIKFMKKAGAIILVSTNGPEKAMGVETSNKLYGRTNNPYNTCKSVGGSSGGEGALLGAGASLIGLGNDTAGSLRIPALYCGVFGHLPSANLVSPHGQLINTGNITTIGPMCRYAEDLAVAMKVLTMDRENVLFDRKVDFKKIKIYYIVSNGHPLNAPVDKDIQRALDKVISYFENTYGTKTTEVKMPILKYSNAIFWHTLIPTIDIEEVKEILRIPKDLNVTKEILKACVGQSIYTFNIPVLLKHLKCPLWFSESDVPYYRELGNKLKQEFNELLDADSIFLCPTLPQTALYHTEIRTLITEPSHASIWNILGFPATHCPLGLNKKSLPIGVQIVSCKNNDALNIAVARELEKAFGGWVPPRR